MANNFSITISAVDKATATVKKVNDSISRTMRPITNMQRSFKSFGKEVARNPAARALWSVAKAAKGVAFSIAKIAGPMLGITSIGALAGIANLANSWGRVGFELRNTSNSLGMSTSGLYSLRGAAKLAGVSAEEMTGALSNLGQALFDAKVGNDNELSGILTSMKIGFHETADGGYDFLAVLKDVSRAMKEQKDVGAKHKLANRLGIDGLFNILDKGPEEIDRLIESLNKLSGVPGNEAINRAEKYTKRLNELGAAVTGLKESIGDKIIPHIQPLIEKTTEYLTKNHAGIADSVGKRTWAFMDPVGYANSLPKPEEKRSGRSSGGKITYPGMAGSPASTLGYNSPELNDYAKDVERRLNLPKNILNGIKNFGERSNSDAVSPKGARGVMQFMPDTWAEYGNGDPTDPRASIDAAGRYMKEMLKRYNGNVDAAITEYNGGVKQAQAVQNGGVPWVAETANYLSRVKNGISQMNGGGASDSQQVTVNVQVGNAPPGTAVTANSSNGTDVPVRISRSMQTTSPL